MAIPKTRNKHGQANTKNQYKGIYKEKEAGAEVADQINIQYMDPFGQEMMRFSPFVRPQGFIGRFHWGGDPDPKEYEFFFVVKEFRKRKGIRKFQREYFPNLRFKMKRVIETAGRIDFRALYHSKKNKDLWDPEDFSKLRSIYSLAFQRPNLKTWIRCNILEDNNKIYLQYWKKNTLVRKNGQIYTKWVEVMKDIEQEKENYHLRELEKIRKRRNG